jgi:hypothetical protein
MKRYRFIVKRGWSTGDYWDFDEIEDGVKFINEVRRDVGGGTSLAPKGGVAIIVQETQEEIMRI